MQRSRKATASLALGRGVEGDDIEAPVGAGLSAPR